MQYRTLGRTGLTVSEVGVGGAQFGLTNYMGRWDANSDDTLAVGRLLLDYVLSNPYVDVALVGMREPKYVEINNAISDDVALRIDLAALHDRYVR